ncbi:MAG: hypothetical protein ACLQUZ_05140 [Rhizomicrobium sp.]
MWGRLFFPFSQASAWTLGERLYLGMVCAAFLIFAAVLMWVSSLEGKIKILHLLTALCILAVWAALTFLVVEPCEYLMCPTWSGFQSFIQISVALNAAYFSVAQFFNPDATNERDKLQNVFEALTEYAKTSGNSALKKRFADKLVALGVNLSAQEVADENFFVLFRATSVFMFFCGIILLFVSSIFAGYRVFWEFTPLFWLLVFPFMIGVGYVVFNSSRNYRKLAASRITISRDMDEAFLSL